tara:strand:+ start:3118 stop:3576 length:459 start_codon:yes stop_codon:yes gene_type:complete
MTTIMSGYNKNLTLAEATVIQADERLDDIRKLLDAGGEYVEDIGELYEYGLCFDAVEEECEDCGTELFSYYRYQISTGGPGTEIRYRPWGDSWRCEFVYLEWFKGHTIRLTGDQHNTAIELLDAHCDCLIDCGIYKLASISSYNGHFCEGDE